MKWSDDNIRAAETKLDWWRFFLVVTASLLFFKLLVICVVFYTSLSFEFRIYSYLTEVVMFEKMFKSPVQHIVTQILWPTLTKFFLFYCFWFFSKIVMCNEIGLFVFSPASVCISFSLPCQYVIFCIGFNSISLINNIVFILTASVCMFSVACFPAYLLSHTIRYHINRQSLNTNVWGEEPLLCDMK